MLTRGTLLAAVALVALVAAPVTAEDKVEPDWGKMLAEKADSVVSIKFVTMMKVTVPGRGVVQEAEQNREIRGTLINDNGLVLTAHQSLTPPPRRFQQATIEASPPRDIKVLFGTETDEFDAQVVATDKNLDLAFVQIMKLGEKKISHVSLTDLGSEPKIGAELWTASRLPRGFDNAPVLGRVITTALVEKPRRMWAIAGTVGGMGMPAFDMDGKVVGILATQEGSEGVSEQGGNVRPFLLPMNTVERVLKMAKERAAKAIDAAKEAEEEAKEGEEAGEKEGEKEEDGEKKEGDPEKPTEEPEKPADVPEKPTENPDKPE